MIPERFLEVAESCRSMLVHLTMSRGHDYDTAHDLVQTGIINALPLAHRCRYPADVRGLLKTVTFRDSANEHRDRSRFNSRHTPIHDMPEDDLESEHFAYDERDEIDLKIDIHRALNGLGEDDREIVRFLFIEGWTYVQTHNMFRDLFVSKTELFEHVHANIMPRLVSVLAAYRKPDPAPCRPLTISLPTYIVCEQVFHDEGYDLVPVTSVVRSHHDARVDQAVLEKRYRERELETRDDWSRRESSEPLTSTLQHLGNRKPTRFFTVRKKVNHE